MTALALPNDDPLFDEKGAAAYLTISPHSLARYRTIGTPSIPFIKWPGRRGPVRYRKSALDAFLASAERNSTSEYDK